MYVQVDPIDGESGGACDQDIGSEYSNGQVSLPQLGT